MNKPKLSPATAKVFFAFNEIMTKAVASHKAELARAEWERTPTPAPKVDTEAGYFRTSFMDVRG